MEFDLVSTCAGFLLGALTGAAGMYYGELFTDQRRKKEKARAERQAFDTVCQQMPDLIAALRLRIEQVPLTRDFLVRSQTAIAFVSDDGSLREGQVSDLPELGRKLRVLEINKYISQATANTVPYPCYTMSQDFVRHLKSIPEGKSQ